MLNNGISVFRSKILEHCFKQEVVQREPFYLDTLEQTYDILKFADSYLGLTTLTSQ
jgi:hypothetical protein